MNVRIEFKELTKNGYESLCVWNVETLGYTHSIGLVTKINAVVRNYWKDGKIIQYDIDMNTNNNPAHN